MKTNTARFTIAAVVVLVVIGGMNFWPGRGTDGKKWWLAPPAVWSQEILEALNEVKGVTCREQLMDVEADGSEHAPMTWCILYVSNDRYRRDVYVKDVLKDIHWYVPDGDGTRHHSIRFDLKSYFTHTDEYSIEDNDPIVSMRARVSFMKEADRLLGTKVIDGYECVGFERSADKSEQDPMQWRVCIWFDVDTKLPVRIEQRGREVTSHPDEAITIIEDQFDYNPDLSADTFVPYIPEGFVFDHPDDIQAAGKAIQQ